MFVCIIQHSCVICTVESYWYSCCRLNAMFLLDFRNMMITVDAAVESSRLFRVGRMMQWPIGDSEGKKLFYYVMTSQSDVNPSDSRNVFKKFLLLHVA
jgi:hypothetical protein